MHYTAKTEMEKMDMQKFVSFSLHHKKDILWSKEILKQKEKKLKIQIERHQINVDKTTEIELVWKERSESGRWRDRLVNAVLLLPFLPFLSSDPTAERIKDQIWLLLSVFFPINLLSSVCCLSCNWQSDPISQSDHRGQTKERERTEKVYWVQGKRLSGKRNRSNMK